MVFKDKKSNIYEVTNYFLSKEAINIKRLQKLVYYTQAWSYTLFNDYFMVSDNDKPATFEARENGPINQELMKRYINYDLVPMNKNKLKFNFSKEQLDLLESVWGTYQEYSANELIYLSCHERPWHNAYIHGNKYISKNDMKGYYSSIYIGDDF